MSVPATNRPMFNQSESKILERALHSMTLASDALTKENQQLREQVASLTSEVTRLRESVILNPPEVTYNNYEKIRRSKEVC